MLFGEDQQEDYRHSTASQQELGATTKTATPNQLKELHPWMTVDDVYRACYTDDGSVTKNLGGVSSWADTRGNASTSGTSSIFTSPYKLTYSISIR